MLLGLSMVEEILVVVLSATGLLGGVAAVVLGFVLKQVRQVAERRRKERMALELQRLEGEEKLSRLILVLIKYSKGICELEELDEAEADYTRYLEANRSYKNEILTAYTTK